MERIERKTGTQTVYKEQLHRPLSLGWKLVSIHDDFVHEPDM